MLKTVMVHQQKQYEFYNHNLSSLFQYLCIKLVIKKLYEFEISTLDDLLILFIKLNTNFLLKGGKFKTSQIRNSQEGLKDEGTFIKTLNTLLKATLTLPIVLLRYLVHIGQQYKLEQYVLKRVILTPVVQCLKLRVSIFPLA